MAIDVSTLTDYSWSDIAKAAKTAMISAALGGARLTINGRDIGRITIDEATTLYGFAKEQEALDGAGAAGAGNVLVRFGQSQ